MSRNAAFLTLTTTSQLIEIKDTSENLPHSGRVAR
jgi:hypothetical protein